MSRRAVVLHVTESYGAGTASAIARFAKSVPEAEHHLIKRTREDSAVRNDDALFASIVELPAPGVRAVRKIRRTARELRPSVIHVHSSLGGALGRAAILNSPARRVVYSPHCYSFERLDLPGWSRTVFRWLEAMLAFNTTVTAACSQREAQLARKLRPRARAVFVPNVAPFPRFHVSEVEND